MPKSWVCVDASLIVALVAMERFSRTALALWQEWGRGAQDRVAPLLLRYEVASALRRKVVDGKLTDDDGRSALKRAMAFKIRYQDAVDLHLRAFDLAAQLKRPNAYDTHYLALAEQLQCPFWTADERLYNAMHEEFPLIRWLGNYQAAV